MAECLLNGKLVFKKYIAGLRLLLLLSILFQFCCNQSSVRSARQVKRCFYYWKSTFVLSPFEKQSLQALEVNTLYIKYFDVDWSVAENTPLPIAQLKVVDSTFLKKHSINIVPIVFITNECIFKISANETERFAQKILILVKQIHQNYSSQTLQEIQIDCDWTPTTKDKYFSILKNLKRLSSSTIFSTTIRLHQIKYAEKTGVPPVAKGMLMCYNMGNLTSEKVKNSIIETAELKKYIGSLQNYPLPLDVAFPLFDWKVLFRNGKFIGLLQNIPDNLLVKDNFSKQANKFTALKDIDVAGFDIKKGDIIRNEDSAYEDILETANVLTEKIKNKNIRVSLYHLDTLTLRKYSLHEIETIFDAMR